MTKGLFVVFFLILNTVSSLAEAEVEPCLQVPDPGFCRAAIPKYYFDQKSMSCKSFIWGGCGGVVPFQDMATCERTCLVDEGNDLKRIEESYQKWLKVSDYNLRPYQYSVFFQSWTGLGNKTILTVKANKVVTREYSSWNSLGTDKISWQEQVSNLGNHHHGAAVKTIDQLYESCRMILSEKQTKDYRLMLKFDTLGLLKQCQYSHKMCADDCASGVSIERLTWLDTVVENN